MNLETSTINVLLGLVIAMQCWIVQELFRLKIKVSLMIAQCPRCRYPAPQLDTESKHND